MNSEVNNGKIARAKHYVSSKSAYPSIIIYIKIEIKKKDNNIKLKEIYA
jgi:hypothetical protein